MTTITLALNLRDAMFQASRRHCQEDWFEGTEYILWDIIEGKADRKSYGYGDGLSEDEVASLRQLHLDSGVWWYLDEDKLVSVETDKWLTMIQEAAE